MKVALFGGSFDPIHKGHEEVIKHLEKKFDKILIVPVKNYNKPDGFLKLEERIYLVRKLYNKNNKIEVLDWNVFDQRISYTYYLLDKIKKENPNYDIHLVVGSDYTDIDNWKKSDFIKKNSSLYKVSRNNGPGIKIKSINVSSSSIRDNIDLSKTLTSPVISQYLLNKPKLLVLDLDHNLFYPTQTKENLNLDQIPMFEDVYFYLRPHLKEFLDYASKNFILAAWSTSGSEYVNHVAKYLFKDYPTLFNWSSKRCSIVRENGFAYKHLKRLDKVKRYFKIPLKDIILIDDSPDKCHINYGNFFYSNKFSGDENDTDLLRLKKILEILKDVPNIRSFQKQDLGSLWLKSNTFIKKKDID